MRRILVVAAVTILLTSVMSAEEPAAPTPRSVPPVTRSEGATPTPAPGEVGASPTPQAVPVVFGGRTLFTLAARVGSFDAQQRAEAITGRIEKIARNPLLKEVTVTVQPTEDGAAILHGDTILMVVTEADARVADLAPVELAKKWSGAIEVAVREGHKSYNLRTLAVGFGAALLATVVLIAILKLLARIVPKASGLIDTWRGRYIPSLRIQKLEIISSDRIADFLQFAVKLFRTGLVVLALYIFIPLVLGFFPWTQGLSHTLFGYLVTPLKAAGQAVIEFLPNFFFLIVIVFLTHYGLRGVRVIFREIEKGAITIPALSADVAEPTYKIVRFLILVFAVIVAFPYLPGSSSKAFQGISLFLGVLFSLGSSSAIANIVAGVILTYTGAFKLGDRVKIADTVGDVIEKTLLVTRVRTIKNVEITVPNGMVLGSHIVNYSAAARQDGLILHTTVTIGYDAPWRQVHDLLIAAARRTEGVLAEPAPFVLQLSLDDYYPSYELNAFTREASRMATINSALHQNIQDTFNEAGVEIMSPAYHALRDGNQITVPADYLSKTYQAPAFRVLPVKLPGEGPPSGDEKD